MKTTETSPQLSRSSQCNREGKQYTQLYSKEESASVIENHLNSTDWHSILLTCEAPRSHD